MKVRFWHFWQPFIKSDEKIWLHSDFFLSNSSWHGEIFTCVIRRATLFHKSLLKFPSVGLISEVPLLTLAVKFGSWNNFQPSRVPKSSWNPGLNNTVIFSAAKRGTDGGNVWIFGCWDGFLVWKLSQLWIGNTLPDPKKGNSFWPANFLFVQLWQFFSLKSVSVLKMSNFEEWNFDACSMTSYNIPLHSLHYGSKYPIFLICFKHPCSYINKKCKRKCQKMPKLPARQGCPLCSQTSWAASSIPARI